MSTLIKIERKRKRRERRMGRRGRRRVERRRKGCPRISNRKRERRMGLRGIVSRLRTRTTNKKDKRDKFKGT